MERTVSVPGKLFLCGEYAVLWGGTARVAAVGPRLSGHVRRRDDREVHVVLQSGRVRGRATPLGANWVGEIPDEFIFAARAIDAVLGAHGRECLGFEVALSPSPQAPDGRKLGFGGSARASLLTAELGRYILEERFDPLKLALLAHASAQSRLGSGADVAAVFAGGVIRYRRYSLDALLSSSASGQLFSGLAQAPPVDLRRLPVPRLNLAYAFTGQSASTPALIAEVERRIPYDARVQFVLDSDQIGEGLEQAMVTGDFASLRQTVSELQALLCSLGGLQNEAMRRVVAIARSYEGAAKMSGAGRGDGCILFSPDPEAQSAMIEGLRARGFWTTVLEVESGLRGELHADEKLRSWLNAG
ncbi:MAG TPA: phosphomevalonate kinase [Myxococcaceae bacterium]|nr:phosphomevalonate kinase [Myxococcaceae bacterium]